MNTHNEIHLLSRDPDRNPPGPGLTGAHLSDEQLTDLLLGTIPPSVTAHLEACPQCAHEAERVSSAIGSFQQQSRLWAEHRTAARGAVRPIQARPIQMPARQPLLPWLNRPAAWSAAAAAVVLATLIGIGTGTAHRDGPTASSRQPAQQPVVAVQPAPQVSTATLKADNELLSAIDGELSADAAPPAGLYGLKTATHVARAKSLKRMSN